MRYSTQSKAPVSHTHVGFKETLTLDGRDLSKEEFRIIPGFEKYEMTKDGDIRNIRSGKLMIEKESKEGVWHYCLYRNDGVSTNRVWERLMWLAYPELKPPPKEKLVVPPKGPVERTRCRRNHEYTEENTRLNKRGYRECRTCANDRAKRKRVRDSERDDAQHVGYKAWRVVYDYPLYEATTKGYVREIHSGRLLEPVHNRFGLFYHLRKGARVNAVKRTEILATTFPEVKAA